MKKILILIVINILILSGFGVFGTSINKNNIKNIIEQTKTEYIDIETLSYEFNNENDNYLKPILHDNELYLLNPGQPMMPRILKQYELPFGITDIIIDVEPNQIQKQTITKQILPAPSPLPYSTQSDIISINSIDERVYNSDDLFPNSWYSYNIGCGLNANAEHVTHLTVNLYPMRYSPVKYEVNIANGFDIKISYKMPDIDIFPDISEYDLVIIGPSKFSKEINQLVNHKNTFGVNSIFKSTEDIYKEYSGLDKAEQIKYFIKDAIETWGVKYVLLFGGLKSWIYSKPKDNINVGESGWYVPVRYSNLKWDGNPNYNFSSGEPGYLTDLYYADIYREGGIFDNWDSNGNEIFAEWAGEINDDLDLYPDIAFGRLACRNIKEARDVVNKIINYEKQKADPNWFNRIIAISGDGFLDQEDWNIQWDTSDLPDGEYTIYGRCSNPEDDIGPIDEIKIILDKTVETDITFNHDDHLNPALDNGYPAPPITEIVSISNNNILGNTDYTYVPNEGQAYCNDFYYWANISYVSEVLTIRGKCYDPKPYGNLTNLELWIENEQGETVFTDSRQNMETYYEGEWVVGEKLLYGRGGAMAYMPDNFEKNSVFTSNGKWFTQTDVIEEFNKGYGLAYFSGHGSPGWWGDHYPGIPGNRRHGQVAGLVVTEIKTYFNFLQIPTFTMNQLSNTNKLPVVCVGGCHNSQFNVSLIPTILSKYNQNYMNTYGTPVPECWGWFMVKLPKTGAIATMGNSGYGWGSEGDVCTIGTGDGWINTEFFRQYGQENQHVLGSAYIQAITNYITHHKTMELNYWRIDTGWDGIDQKTVEQWILLGDPSLIIGGYQ